MLIQIDGWFGSGKAVLWTLLEGHPDVFCSPIHDFSYMGFLNQTNELDWVTTKHVEILRKILARTQYFKYEKVFWDGFWTFEFSSNEILKLPYLYDFYKHDRMFMEKIMSKEKWKIEDIIDTLYECVFLSRLGRKETEKIPRYFATASNALMIDDYVNFPKLFPNGKSIQVRRDIEKIIAVRSSRKPRPEDFKTKTFFSDGFEKRVNEGEIEKILAFYEKYEQLMNANPNQYMLVDFDDLVFNTEESMHKVAEFLQIPFHEALTMASYNGEELLFNNKKFIGQETDKVEDLLTVEERRIIQSRIEQYYKNGVK